jgi:phosphoribosylglycinamide formyltransferase 1
MKNIVILISGSGSNMRAIVQAAHSRAWGVRLGAQVAAVISNQPDAAGLIWAREQGLPTAVLSHKDFKTAANPREAFDASLLKLVQSFDPALVVLAGFMRILTPVFVAPLEGKLVNIHPSLLPAFPGLHTHERAIAEGCKLAGCTVHRVVAQLDAGPILDQAAVPVLAGDTAQTLAARVLTQEHMIYPKVIEELLSNK